MPYIYALRWAQIAVGAAAIAKIDTTLAAQSLCMLEVPV